MKKFGPYMGVTSVGNKGKDGKEEPVNRAEPNKDVKSSEFGTAHQTKPDITEIKKRYKDYIEKHNRLSESLEPENPEKDDD